MSGNFFDRLEGELAALTRDGSHLDELARRGRREALGLLRRATTCALLALALAVCLVGEFPAIARGHVQVTQGLTTRVV